MLIVLRLRKLLDEGLNDSLEVNKWGMEYPSQIPLQNPLYCALSISCAFI